MREIGRAEIGVFLRLNEAASFAGDHAKPLKTFSPHEPEGLDTPGNPQ